MDRWLDATDDDDDDDDERTSKRCCDEPSLKLRNNPISQ
jgi:hypothetical protein